MTKALVKNTIKSLGSLHSWLSMPPIAPLSPSCTSKGTGAIAKVFGLLNLAKTADSVLKSGDHFLAESFPFLQLKLRECRSLGATINRG